MKQNSLSFNHFRKFEHFPEVDFNDITFLVGKNNSGKSTFVKALVLLHTYLKSDNLKSIDLNALGSEHFNIITYGRAYSRFVKDTKDKNFIDFKMEIDDFTFYLNLSAKQADSSILDVHELKISHASTKIILAVNPQIDTFSITKDIEDSKYESPMLKQLRSELETLKNSQKQIIDKFSEEYLETNHEILNIEHKIETLQYSVKLAENVRYPLEGKFTEDKISGLLNNLYVHLVSSMVHLSDAWVVRLAAALKPKKNSASENRFFKDIVAESKAFSEEHGDLDISDVDMDKLEFMEANSRQIDSFSQETLKFLQNFELHYLPATLTKQSALFSVRDEQNSLAQAVHFYYQASNAAKDRMQYFIDKWFKIFEIGENLKINLIAGEAYTVELDSGGFTISLADKGMGSVQAALLILRIASIIANLKEENNENQKAVFVTIEEPELNLHPELQTKISDLFYEVYEEYKIKFVVETHSEYLVRQTQFLVKDKELEIAPNDNPFTVIYFNDDMKIWSMEYREDGKFKNDFGTGFFDETRKTVKKML